MLKRLLLSTPMCPVYASGWRYGTWTGAVKVLYNCWWKLVPGSHSSVPFQFFTRQITKCTGLAWYAWVALSEGTTNQPPFDPFSWTLRNQWSRDAVSWKETLFLSERQSQAPSLLAYMDAVTATKRISLTCGMISRDALTVWFWTVVVMLCSKAWTDF